MTDYRIELGFDFASVNDLSVPYFNPERRACLLQEGVVNLDQGSSPAWYTGFQLGDTVAFDLFDVSAGAVNVPLGGGVSWDRVLVSFEIFFGNPYQSVRFQTGLAPAKSSPSTAFTQNPFLYAPASPYTTDATATSYVFGGQQYPHFPIGSFTSSLDPLKLDKVGKYIFAVQVTIRDQNKREKVFAMDPEPIVSGTSSPAEL